MTSAAPASIAQPPTTATAPSNAPSAHASGTTPSLSGAVPAQHPARSYATATKTATPPTSAGASAPAQNAKPATDSQVNGAMAQGGSQTNTQLDNGVTNGDHGRKPSVVINSSGVYGSTPNGAPNDQKSPINFGSLNNPNGLGPQHHAPFQSQNSALATPLHDPRVISPSHSPSPIPQPAESGGRPQILESQNNPLRFGNIGPDGDMMRGSPMSQGPMGQMPLHERRQSSQSMQSDPSSQGMQSNYNRANMGPQGAGRGRGFQPQATYMQSPVNQYRPMAGQQGRNNMQGFQQQQQPPPGSPFQQHARASPVPRSAQPHMSQPHMGGNPQMHYQGYPQHLNPQQMYNMQGYDPNAGYYQQYYYPNYQGQQAPQSPRPHFPSPFQGAQGQMSQPPYHPPPTPGMARTPSQASERPPSSVGHPPTPAQNASAPSQSQGPSQPAQPSPNNFVRPQRNKVVIKDAQGNELNFDKKPSTPAAPTQQPQTPVIVSTPHAPTPPPRTPSSQQNRTDNKSAKSSEDTKASFAEQVRRKKEEDEAKEKGKVQSESKPIEPAAVEVVKEAVAETEKAAATAADDKPAEAEAEAALSAVHKAPEEQDAKEETEDERIEREIAEMEAAEKAEEERERAYQEKKAKDRAAASANEKTSAAKQDEELKRQEREAEEREAERERERNGEKKTAEEPDDQAKAMFASLKRPTLGPGATAPDSGAETPVSDDDSVEPSAETSTESQPAAAPPRAAGTQKPKPAHLKLETNKPVERAEPTPGMRALEHARFLAVKDELKYPEGVKSPNPALNQAAQSKSRVYDKDFLLQFQKVFSEKPSVDWDQKVRETLGPGDESARPQSARTPSGLGGRQPSGRPGQTPIGNFGGPMGNFGGMARGTTSADRFNASTTGGGMGMPPRPGAPGIARAPSNLGMGTPGVGMSRTNSVQMMSSMGAANSPRQASSRGGKGGSRRDDRVKSRREDADMAAKMPLTAHIEIAPLERSTVGWKASSLAPGQTGPDPSGLMDAPMVQRKVKAALNKMTPEKFEKISDQILEIAGQSKNETDGRTLRQVIQLTFEKACDEAHWAGMYARFCHKMHATMNNDIRDETIRDKGGNPVVGGALFRKYLLNRCQEEFERGWQANLPDKPEGESGEAALLSEEYYIAAAAKRRGLGLIQFIGQLYKLRMLTLRIMHECVMRLLNFEGEPDESAVENLTTLLKAVGATMEEEEQGRTFMDAYFERINNVILGSSKLASRPRFMIMDLLDLRKAGWKGKNDSKGPKTIQQIHEEAEALKAKEEAERQRSGPRGGPGGGRMPQGRGDARNFSGNMPPPQDFTRTHVNNDDLRRLSNRPTARTSGPSLGPGGSLSASMLGARNNSKRGAVSGAGSGNTTRTNTPPVESKREEPTQSNAFSALASLDSGEGTEEAAEATSPPTSRGADKDESSKA